MKIVFVDPTWLDYTADTPLREPLGGTQSAVAYLTIELARLGQEVTVINGVPQSCVSAGVQFVGRDKLSGHFLDQFQVVVVASVAIGHRLRSAGVSTPMVLWCEYAHDQPAVKDLGVPAERNAWNGYAMVSKWQADHYASAFGVPSAAMHLLGNAISPAFADVPRADPWFVRGDPPVLAYTSTPFRGLDVLLMAFPAIRNKVPNARLRVFSGMSLYRASPEDDSYSVLYDLCRALPGAEYVGPVSQVDLARAMVGVDVLAYPCTFAETSCIAAMEAMASGALIVTSDLGALGETTAGFGHLMKLNGDRINIAKDYAAFVSKELNEAARDPGTTALRLAEQRRHARERYSWARRAEEWMTWLRAFIG